VPASVDVRKSGISWAAFLRCEECNVGAIYSPMETMEDALKVGDDMMMLHDLDNHGTEA
jgi:hypothetical protein